MDDDRGGELAPPDFVGSERIEFDDRMRQLEREDKVRLWLTLGFIAIFAGTILMSFLHLAESDWANTKEWLQALLPAETALIGSATGFYFGSSRRGPDQ